MKIKVHTFFTESGSTLAAIPVKRETHEYLLSLPFTSDSCATWRAESKSFPAIFGVKGVGARGEVAVCEVYVCEVRDDEEGEGEVSREADRGEAGTDEVMEDEFVTCEKTLLS